MENNYLNKINTDEQDTPAPYFINQKVDAETKANSTKNTESNHNNNTPTLLDKEESVINKSNKQNTPPPIQNKKQSLNKKDGNLANTKNQTEKFNNLDKQTETIAENKKDKQKDKRKSKTKKPKAWVWIVKVFVLAVVLSLIFSLLSEFTLSKTNIVVSVIVILVFIAVSIMFDMLGLAVASCQLEPFTAMAARKVPGSKLALGLIKNADKVSAICCDVIGDVCGILAGAGGASILTKIAITSSGFMPIFVASLISAIIAGLTIGGKASFKRLARAKSNPITLKFAQVLNLFVHKK